MKKLKKINLELNKEVISSLSGNEMNNVKGGTNLSYNPNLICTGTDTASINVNLCPQPVTRDGSNCNTCPTLACPIQTDIGCRSNGANVCAVTQDNTCPDSCMRCVIPPSYLFTACEC